MSNPSNADNDSPRRSRTRRREAMISATATVIGCMALVVMIATVVRVVTVKLWDSTKVNPEYLQSVYESELEHRWSGGAGEQPALLSPQTPSDASRGKSTATVAVTTRETPSVDARLRTASAIHDIESKRSKIEPVVRGFFEASGAEQKQAFVRDPQRVRPLMENYYHDRRQEPRTWKSLGWVLPVEEPGYRLGYAQALFADAEPVSLIIEEQPDGSFRVDWESSVRYGEIDWGEFIRTRPVSPTLFRVIASKPRHAPSADGAPQNTEVLEIKHPDGDGTLYAWFDRKDPKFQPLIQQLQTGNWKDVPLTLRLCYTGPAAGGSSVKIVGIEGKGWLILQGTRS